MFRQVVTPAQRAKVTHELSPKHTWWGNVCIIVTSRPTSRTLKRIHCDCSVFANNYNYVFHTVFFTTTTTIVWLYPYYINNINSERGNILIAHYATGTMDCNLERCPRCWKLTSRQGSGPLSSGSNAHCNRMAKIGDQLNKNTLYIPQRQH